MSCVVHECEKGAQPDKFGTIMGSMWYSIVSCTTIGYGDMFPITTLGKVAAAICILGALMAVGTYFSIMNTIIHNALDDYDQKKQ